MRILVLILCMQLVGVAPVLAAAPTATVIQDSWVAKASKKKRKKRRKRRRKRRRSKKRVKAVKKVAPKAVEKAAVEPTSAPVVEAEPQTKPPELQPSAEPSAVPSSNAPAKEPGDDERQSGVAVMQLQAVHGVEKSLADLLSELLLTRITQSNVFRSVIGGSDLQEVMSLEQQKDALGCDNDSCLAALGGALGVPMMIVPSIGKLGSQFLLNIKLMDVEEAKVLGRANCDVNLESELKVALENLVDELLKSAFNTTKPQPSPKPNVGMAATGFGFAGVGVLSTVGAFVLNQSAQSRFDESKKTLADYDQGLETTHYANTALIVGLSATVVGGIFLKVSLAPWLSAL